MKYLEVNAKDLQHNLELLKEHAGRTQIIGIVKANGMGLDLIKYSKFLLQNGIKILAVANTSEAEELRIAGIDSTILMLSEVYNPEEIEILIRNDVILTIGSLKEREKIQKIALKTGKDARIHVKIDTGFGRYGFLYDDEENILEAIQDIDAIKVVGCYTHFSKAIDYKSTKLQFERFSKLIPKIRELNPNIIFHCSNSTAFLLYPEMNLDAVRLGSAIQGRVLKNTLGLKKIGTFKSEIVTIKEVPKGYNISYSNEFKTKRKTKIAIVPVGYIDGLNLKNARDSFSFKDNIISVGMEIKKIFKKPILKVNIRNMEYPIIGRLGMYHAAVDITDNSEIQIGDEVILNVSPIYTNSNIRREYI